MPIAWFLPNRLQTWSSPSSKSAPVSPGEKSLRIESLLIPYRKDTPAYLIIAAGLSAWAASYREKSLVHGKDLISQKNSDAVDDGVHVCILAEPLAELSGILHDGRDCGRSAFDLLEGLVSRTLFALQAAGAILVASLREHDVTMAGQGDGNLLANQC